MVVRRDNKAKYNSYPYQNLSLPDIKGEIWKEVSGYEGYLMVSNKGRVKGVKRLICQKTNNRTVFYEVPEKIRRQQHKPQYNKILKKDFPSLVVSIKIDGSVKSFYISRLVYSAFHGKITTEQKILHKDHDNLNNKLENLYIGDSSEVNRRTAAQGRTNVPEIFAEKRKQWPIERRKKLQDRTETKIAVCQFDLEGRYINEYPSIREAYRQTGSQESSIRLCIHGKQKTAGGFLWKRKEQ